MTEVIDTADPVLSYACGYNSHIATRHDLTDCDLCTCAWFL